jgi:hypothetical protein
VKTNHTTFNTLEKSNVLSCRIRFKGSESLDDIRAKSKGNLPLIDEQSLLEKLREETIKTYVKREEEILKFVDLGAKDTIEILSEIQEIILNDVERL